MEEKWRTASEIAARLKIHRSTVGDLARRHNLSTKIINPRVFKYKESEIKRHLSLGHRNGANAKFVGSAVSRTYNDYWKLDWDEFILGCDTHIPHYHEGIINRMLEFAEHHKIKNFIHPGDFFDQTAFSRFDSASEDISSLSEEIEAGRTVIKALKSVFSDIRFTLGSHDVRLWLNLLKQGKEIPFDEPWRLVGENVEVSRFRYAEINDEWRVTHPKSVMRIGGIGIVRAIAKFQRSIIFGHGHWWGIEKDPSGKHYAIAPGCLVDKKRVAYASLWDTSHNEWVPGFVAVLDRNKPILLEEGSPWEIYLG